MRGAFGSLGVKVASTGLNFAISLMLARLLGTGGFGIYSYAIAWVALLSIPATLGLDKLVAREVAIYQTQSAWGLMRGLLRWTNQTVLGVSFGLAAIAIAITWSLKTALAEPMFLSLCIAFLALPILALRSLRLEAMKGLHRVVLGQVPEFLIAPVLLFCFTVASYLFWKKDIAPAWIVSLHVMTLVVTFSIGARWLNQALPQQVKTVAPNYAIRSWLRSAIPLMFLGGMEIINARTDVVMLGAMQGSEAVGIYTVVNKISQLIVFVLVSVNSALAPTATGLYVRGQFEQLQQIVTQSARIIFLISLPIAGSLMIFGDWFLRLFGSDFLRGQTALTILSVGQLVNASSGSVGLLLTMTGHENYTAIGVGTSALLNVILNLLLIPSWGIEGAAVATASSTILWNIMGLIWVQKKLKLDPTALGKLK